MKLSTLIFFVAAAQLTACKSTSTTDYARTNGEQLLLDSGSYSALIKRYEDELKEASSHQTRAKLANVHYLTGDAEAALFQLQQIPESNKNSPDLALLQANVYFDLGRSNLAEQYANTALRLDGKLGEAHNLKGLILADRGEISKAKQAFESARIYGHDDPTVKNNLAMIAILQGDYTKASNLLMPLVKSGRADQTVQANLILALAKSGKTQAFSQLLAGEDGDIHLAEKYEVLRTAKALQRYRPQTDVLPQTHIPLAATKQPEQTETNEAALQPPPDKAPSTSLPVLKALTQAETPAPIPAGIAKPDKVGKAKQPAIAAAQSQKKAGPVPQMQNRRGETTKPETVVATNVAPEKEASKHADPLTLIKRRLQQTRDAQKIAQTKKAAEKAALTLAKKKKARKTKNHRPSRKLVTNIAFTRKPGGVEYIATSDFNISKFETLYLKKRKKWVFDIHGAHDFSTKRKRYLKEGPAESIELGEHKGFVRIVLTMRDASVGQPHVSIENNKLIIRWDA